MVGKTEPISDLDRERFEKIKSFCGCLPCLLMGISDIHTTIEHVTVRGRREGHQATIGMCGWHHFGAGTDNMVNLVGPSLAKGRRLFEAHFGDESTVLLLVQDYLIERFDRKPWPEYNVPRQVARQTREFWEELKDAAST